MAECVLYYMIPKRLKCGAISDCINMIVIVHRIYRDTSVQNEIYSV